MSITKAQYDAVVAERDQARREAFELKTRVAILEVDLARARRDIASYQRNWNISSNENKNLRLAMQKKRCR